MASDEVTTWVGGSGTEYQFFIFDLDTDVPARPGLYIYSRKNHENVWVAVYMGHGDLSVRCSDPGLLGCIREKGSTHVHLRLAKRHEDRVEELRDLLTHYPHTFAPDGCQPEADRPAEAPSPSIPETPGSDAGPAEAPRASPV